MYTGSVPTKGVLVPVIAKEKQHYAKYKEYHETKTAFK